MSAMQIRRRLACMSVLVVLGVSVGPVAVHAEPSRLQLSIQRIKGSDLLGRVAGSFRVAVQGSENLRLVTFYLDGRPIGHASGYPFAVQFDTSDFPKGAHRLEAVAHYSNGSVTTSNPVFLDFRSDNWHLVVRQSMFLYAAMVMALAILGGLLVHRLLRIQPRLVLLNR